MTDVRLIQVPWYLGREHPDLSRGPGVLAAAIGGETVVVPGPEPRPVPNEVADSFEVIGAVRSAVSEAVDDGRLAAGGGTHLASASPRPPERTPFVKLFVACRSRRWSRCRERGGGRLHRVCRIKLGPGRNGGSAARMEPMSYVV